MPKLRKTRELWVNSVRQAVCDNGKDQTVIKTIPRRGFRFVLPVEMPKSEPKISHLKSDHRMGRCFLARLRGDAINAVLAAAGANLRKLLGLLRRAAGRFLFAHCDMAERLSVILIRRLSTMTTACHPLYPAHSAAA